MSNLLDRRVLFVGGKGGVGKTTIAACLALIAADRGRRCLLVSTDPAHSLSDIFEKTIAGSKTEIVPGVWGLEIDPDTVTDEHLETLKYNMRSLVKPSLYSQIDQQINLARQAPGMLESAMLERLSELMVESRNGYDHVIFDTAPTGHTLRLLSLPEIMTAWTDGLLKRQKRFAEQGDVLNRFQANPETKESYHQPQNSPLNEQRNRRIRSILLKRTRKFRRARRILLDGQQSAFILVLNPEKLPIVESQKAFEALQRIGIEVQMMIVNRVLPECADGAFLSKRRQQEALHLTEIDNRFIKLKRCRIPLLPRDVCGLDSLTTIQQQLETIV